MHLTVAICTWNRSAQLAATLESLRGLVLDEGDSWDVVVVDNNSTDNTSQVLERLKSTLPLTGVFEGQAGKSHAANAAVAAARGDLIAWTDDDVEVSAGWLSAYARAAREWPDASFFAGTVEPWFEAAPPGWVSRNLDLLRDPYALAALGTGTFPMTTEPVMGVNMATRTAVARAFPFNTDFGPKGAAPLRGEDTELVGRLRAAGHVGVWVGDASVRHFIPAKRMTGAYLWHWYSGLGAAVIYEHGLAETAPLFGFPRWALRRYVGLLLQCQARAPFRSRGWLMALKQAALFRGYLFEARRRRYDALH